MKLKSSILIYNCYLMVLQLACEKGRDPIGMKLNWKVCNIKETHTHTHMHTWWGRVESVLNRKQKI
jgi:hypothetical protein